jgi:hypothetical protein
LLQAVPQQPDSVFESALQHPWSPAQHFASAVQHLLSLPQQAESFLQHSAPGLQQSASGVQQLASAMQQLAVAPLILQLLAFAPVSPAPYAYPASPSASIRTIVFMVFISVSPVIKALSVDRQDRRN